MTDPMEAIIKLTAKANLFPVTSRYHGIDTDTLETVEGRTITYLRRRFVPQPEGFTVIQEHSVIESDRLDNLSSHYLGDPEQFWRLCDANGIMHPEELTETIGRRVRITLPEGISGGQNV